MASLARPMALILLLPLSLAGCGPQYRTFTSYDPPVDQAGQHCISSCLDLKTLCRREKDLEVRQCRVDAREDAAERTRELERTFHLELARYAAGALETLLQTPQAASPNYAACSRTDSQLESRCGGDFDICYQTCGGRITHATHCVANCEP